MGYSVVRGGAEAMQAAEEMLDFVRLGGLDRGDAEAAPPTSEVIDMMLRSQRSAVDRIMAEAGFYAPRLAATALVQAEGDAIEASFILRSLRASLPRIEPALPVEVAKMRVLRRISSAFKEVPGGQYLGPTRDYTLRFLRRALEDELPAARLSEVIAALGGDDGALPEMPRVVEMLREMGLISQPPEPPEEEPVDITMQPLRFPRPPRSARLQALARGETGMLNGLAYSSLRGYGHVHPTLGELRVGAVPVRVKHPQWDVPVDIGEVTLTLCDGIISGVAMVTATGDEDIRLDLGFGASFGQQEARAISMAILDGCLAEGTSDGPADDMEFVLYHIDGIESLGFVEHLKQPHYMLFASVMDRLAGANARRAEARDAESRANTGEMAE